MPSSENPLKPTGMDRCLPGSDRGYQQDQGRSPSKGNAELRWSKYGESYARSEHYSNSMPTR